MLNSAVTRRLARSPAAIARCPGGRPSGSQDAVARVRERGVAMTYQQRIGTQRYSRPVERGTRNVATDATTTITIRRTPCIAIRRITNSATGRTSCEYRDDVKQLIKQRAKRMTSRRAMRMQKQVDTHLGTHSAWERAARGGTQRHQHGETCIARPRNQRGTVHVTTRRHTQRARGMQQHDVVTRGQERGSWAGHANSATAAKARGQLRLKARRHDRVQRHHDGIGNVL